MFMATSDLPPASPAWPARAVPTLRTHRAGDPGRAGAEAFIREVYVRRFGADVDSFAPVLVTLGEGDGIVAAAGYRGAGETALFLERYLPQPVEAMLAAHAGHAPPRRRIVEVGHLAATLPGEGRRLIQLLGPHLAREGYQWVVSTLTQELRRLFLRIGVAPLSLAAADPAALGAAAQRWGSYYEHAPVVLAGHLPQALRHLQRRAEGRA